MPAKHWTEDEIKKAVEYVKNGSSLHDISRVLKRPVGGIAWRLNKQGYMTTDLRKELQTYQTKGKENDH